MATVSGAIQQWQRVTIDFLGPLASEESSTFTDYRLDVEFHHAATGQTITVPGFFAADGDAANTGATSGDVWRVHFNPPAAGEWTYTVSFRTGRNVAASTDPNAGTAIALNGEGGSLEVATAAATGSEFRTDGMLVQQGHYYVHKGNGELWIKGGSDSPENFLGYEDFDGTYDQDGGTLKSYAPHQQDYREGDPTWTGGRGSELIGAINYLASQGVNSQYMLLMNVGGDGRDVWPWTSPTARTTFDVSKLAQWEIVFEHMDNVGVAQHFVLQETENDQLLGGMTVERSIYIREMVARFGHHNGVTWNLGEETTNTTTEIKAFASYLKALDGYDHPVVVHTYPGQWDNVYGPLLGYRAFDGISLQADSPRGLIAQYYAASKAAGDTWLANWDEVGPSRIGLLPDANPDADANHDMLRAKMWGALTAGSSGVEWYFGYNFEGDLANQNFRVREDAWEWTTHAREFFETLPLQQMEMEDGLTPSTADFVISKPGEVYVIYQPSGGPASLNLTEHPGTYDVTWYNPRTGEYVEGGVEQVGGGGTVNLGSPPAMVTEDWAILVTKTSNEPAGPVEAPPPVTGPVEAPPVEAPPPATGLGRLYLVDAATDAIVTEIASGMKIDSALLGGRTNLTLAMFENVADTAAASAIESVSMTFDNGIIAPVSRTEDLEPYALYGDTDADHAGGLVLDTSGGLNTLVARYYSEDALGGTLLGQETFSFSIGPPVPSTLGRLYLVDAATDVIVTEITSGMKIDAALLAGRTSLTLAVFENDAGNSAIESVGMTFDNGMIAPATRTESVEPYALYGDSDGNYGRGLALDTSGGLNTLLARYYSEDALGGTLLGQEVFDFSVNQLVEPPAAAGSLSINTDGADDINNAVVSPDYWAVV